MPSTQYLFLFTIGPVQGFIAQARKTRDLYAGSAILGEIISAAIDQTKKMAEKSLFQILTLVQSQTVFYR